MTQQTWWYCHQADYPLPLTAKTARRSFNETACTRLLTHRSRTRIKTKKGAFVWDWGWSLDIDDFDYGLRNQAKDCLPGKSVSNWEASVIDLVVCAPIGGGASAMQSNQIRRRFSIFDSDRRLLITHFCHWFLPSASICCSVWLPAAGWHQWMNERLASICNFFLPNAHWKDLSAPALSRFGGSCAQWLSTRYSLYCWFGYLDAFSLPRNWLAHLPMQMHINGQAKVHWVHCLWSRCSSTHGVAIGAQKKVGTPSPPSPEFKLDFQQSFDRHNRNFAYAS